MPDRHRKQGEDADGGEDQLRVLPGEVGDPVIGGSTPWRGKRETDTAQHCTRIQSEYFEIQIKHWYHRSHGPPRIRPGVQPRLRARPHRRALVAADRARALLGPLRFSDLGRARSAGRPTDVLTKRLRDLEQHGIVARRELEPPASAIVYELTELGRGLERPMIELGRWGMSLQRLDDVIDLDADLAAQRAARRPRAAARLPS